MPRGCLAIFLSLSHIILKAGIISPFTDEKNRLSLLSPGHPSPLYSDISMPRVELPSRKPVTLGSLPLTLPFILANTMDVSLSSSYLISQPCLSGLTTPSCLVSMAPRCPLLPASLSSPLRALPCLRVGVPGTQMPFSCPATFSHWQTIYMLRTCSFEL